MRKITVFIILVVAAIAIAIATKPAFALRDMRSISSATAAAESAAAAAAAAATSAAAGGTFKSLKTPSGERRTGFPAVQAFAYSAHKSYTIWLIAAAKFLSFISTALETDQLKLNATCNCYVLVPTPNYWASALAIVVWIAALGSAVSAGYLLRARAGGTIDESKRISKARIVGFVVFLIGVALAYLLTVSSTY